MQKLLQHRLPPLPQKQHLMLLPLLLRLQDLSLMLQLPKNQKLMRKSTLVFQLLRLQMNKKQLPIKLLKRLLQIQKRLMKMLLKKIQTL